MLFQSIVRQWCKIYTPILDNPNNGNRRFFLTDTREGLVELVKNFEPKMSPSVIMESGVEVSGKIRRPDRNFPIYFFVKARTLKDGDAAAEANEEAYYHCKQFLSWVIKMQEEEQDMGRSSDDDFTRIHLDDFISIDPVGPIGDGWYAVLLQIDQDDPLDLCIDESLYIDPNDIDDDGQGQG